MQKILLILGFILLLSCKKSEKQNCKQESLFKICSDTTFVNYKGYLVSAAFFKNKFYSLFYELNANHSISRMRFYILTKYGEFLEEIVLPDKDNGNYEVCLRHDSIILDERNMKKRYYLNTNNSEFQEINTTDNLIYEDESYYITRICHGEFGGIVYFTNKNTHKTYEVSSTCAIVVNKIDSIYYITNYLGHLCGFTNIMEIDNPESLKQTINLNKNYNLRQGASIQGIKLLFDSIDFHISSSFVLKKKLYHMYINNSKTYISQLEDKKMKIIYTFQNKIYPSYSQTLSEDSKLLIFNTDKDSIFGFLETNKNGLRLHYLIKK